MTDEGTKVGTHRTGKTLVTGAARRPAEVAAVADAKLRLTERRCTDGSARLSAHLLIVVVLTAATMGLWSPAPASASGSSLGQRGRLTGPLSPRLESLARAAAQGASRTNEAHVVGLPPTGAGSLLRRPDGRILVRLRLTDLSRRTRTAVVATGATFVADGHDNATATVAIATTQLTALASLPGLRWAQEEMTPRVNGDTALARSAGRAALVAQPGASAAAARCPSGIVSEGDVQLKAAAARAASTVNGAGVKVGILSDSYNALGGAATDVANGELPGRVNPCGFTTDVQNLGDYKGPGSTDEGRAMAQIVHDLAPGATLAFHTAFNGEQDFADGIRALRNAGATIILDDVSYDDEPMFQDGVIATAIDDVRAAGVTYFSSAANSNLVAQGQEVGSYEAPAYRPTVCPPAVHTNDPQASCHDFDPMTGVSSSDLLTVPGDSGGGSNGVSVMLGWSQPQFGVTTDFDLYLLNATSGAIVARAIVLNIQSGDASETLDYVNTSQSTAKYRLVIARSRGAGSPRIKVIFPSPSAFTDVQWRTSLGGDIVGPTIYGHNAPLAGASVAATPFDRSDQVELFSSRGPALYCWQPVRGAVPSAATSPCQVKQVDFAATDGAANSFFPGGGEGLRFYGTSAAAPHAAAVAALQRQRQPCRTPGEILAALRASGRPVGAYHADAAGSGLIDATTAVSGLAQCPPGAPVMPAIVSTTRSSATIAWARPASLGSPIMSYRITAYTGQSSTPSQTINSGTTATRVTVSGLAGGMLHRFRVAATNGVGTGPASAFTAYVVPPFPSLAAFSTRQFSDFAGRDPTSAELTRADAALAAGTGGTIPASQVVAATQFSNWGPKVDPVTRLYYSFFRRPPDSGGLGLWSSRERSGMSLGAIANSFAASREFKDTYGELSNRQFVDLAYRNVLGRAGDPAGIKSWTAQLDSHEKTRGAVMLGFSESTEHKLRRAGEVNTVDVFFGMLRRVPTTAELKAWTPLSKTSKIALVTSLLRSTAYSLRTSTSTK
jgi:hypothetical protein